MTRRKRYVIYLAGIAAFLFSPCLIKSFTGYPCPACGTRRALEVLLKGRFTESFLINPYAILGTIFLVVLSFIVIYDYLTGSCYLSILQKRSRRIFLRKDILFILVCLMIANWIWNIYKGL